MIYWWLYFAKNSDGNYDLVILGTRKIGGIKKMFLGSVCNAVVQVVRTNVMIITH